MSNKGMKYNLDRRQAIIEDAKKLTIEGLAIRYQMSRTNVSIILKEEGVKAKVPWGTIGSTRDRKDVFHWGFSCRDMTNMEYSVMPKHRISKIP